MIGSTENIYPLFIDRIVKDFCREKGKYEEANSENVAIFINSFCCDLISAFEQLPNNCNYRLDMIKSIEISENAEMGILQNCEISIEFLNEHKVIHEDEKYTGIASYYSNKKIQELVDNFLKIIKSGDVYTVCSDCKGNSILENNSQYNCNSTESDDIISDIIALTDNYITEILEIKKSAEKELSHVTTTNITTMGIFVAIIVAFISAYLTGDAVIKVGTIETIQLQFIFALFLGQLLFNIIFFLIFMIARVSHRKISLECNYNPEICKNFVCSDSECGALRRTWRKYPYMIVVNIICLVGDICFVDWWIIEKYVYLGNISTSLKVFVLFFCIITSVILIELILTIFVKIPMYSDRKKKKPFLIKCIEFITDFKNSGMVAILKIRNEWMQKKINNQEEKIKQEKRNKNLKNKYQELVKEQEKRV